ncbi:MAG: hypothetical protein PHS46_04520 [Candidatus Omnitrophica bacterium]|nr:hypothetical protein [Candidatus Omnitrophota bacterium]
MPLVTLFISRLILSAILIYASILVWTKNVDLIQWAKTKIESALPVNPQSSEKPYIVSQSIIKGVLPVCTIKKIPYQAFGEKLEQEEDGLYFILEISTENQPLNLSHIILKGELFLSGNEGLWLKGVAGKTLYQINNQISEKRPYYAIKWVTSSPIPNKFDKNESTLALFVLKEQDTEQGRSFLSDSDDHLKNYVGYKTLGQAPKLESTHPNIQEFLEKKIDGNKTYFSNIRKDFLNGNIKWYLKIGEKEILIPNGKIKPIKFQPLGQEDDILKVSLESIYYRKSY